MSGTAAELVHDLEETRDETLGFFEVSAEELSRTYAVSKWSARFLRLADSETVDYWRVPLDLSRAVYLSVRNAISYFAAIHMILMPI